MKGKYNFKAVIFDLDGVITQTALLHSRAWRVTFDDYLLQRKESVGENSQENYREVSAEDYLQYIDGRPRYEGVQTFLESRAIHIPYGEVDDIAERETICGIGNRKNENFNKLLQAEGIAVYDSTVNLIFQLREQGIKIAVASSSKNCRQVLERVGLWQYFDAHIDGNTLAEKGLKGKPEPAIFLEAAAALSCIAYECVVVEDAAVGVKAGKAGNFGLVLGLARENNERELLANGADVVVKDMADFSLQQINDWFTTSLEQDSWSITYHDYNPQQERLRETLLALGNGYFCMRGAMQSVPRNAINYPATYIAGVYNTLATTIAGKEIFNEDLINAPDTLPISFKINEGEWFDINRVEVLYVKRILNMYNGLYTCHLHVRDAKGYETLVKTERFVSMSNPHKAMMRYSITPLDYAGAITFKSGINCAVRNEGVPRYKQLNNQHLIIKEIKEKEGVLCSLVATNESEIEIAETVMHEYYYINNICSTNIEYKLSDDKIFEEVAFFVEKNKTITLEKTIVIYTSKHDKVKSVSDAAFHNVKNKESFAMALQQSEKSWEKIWNKCEVKIPHDRLMQKLLHLNFYHVLISMSPNNVALDASIGARGLHGEAYRGHIFWDEVFVIPLYAHVLPEVAKAMLNYRYSRLEEAKKYARQFGYKGAMFPWQSASKGDEQTQVVHLNPLSGKWDADNSALQRHVSLAVAYNILEYYKITNDTSFMIERGGEILLEICRFWDSKCVWNKTTGRYDIDKVMGPDEFHEKYIGAEKGGLKNNAYTNLMSAWVFNKVLQFVEQIKNKEEYLRKFGFILSEIKQWKEIADNLTLNINNEGIIEQFEGYFDLKELDWENYKAKYNDFHRLDRILKAEGLSPDAYKVSKQADLLMIFYLLDKQEVSELVKQMGYNVPDNYVEKNFAYYYQRTSHGSTLSRVVHAKVAAAIGKKELASTLYKEALASDYEDIQGGTTGEGIHAGVMAATVYMAMDKNFINTIQ